MKRGVKARQLPVEELKRLRRKELSVKELAEHFNCTDNIVRSNLKRLGIYKKDKSGPKIKIVEGWDTPAKLTQEDIEFLIKYDLKEFIK